MEVEAEADEQEGVSTGNAKLEFFDEMEEEEDAGKGGVQKPAVDIKVRVCSCRREGNDWIYDIKVGVALHVWA